MNFEELYHAHKNLVYNLALQYVQNREEAEEITQDVFVRVHAKLSSYRAEAQLSTWIGRIAVNCALDYLKARKRQKRFAFIRSLFGDSGEFLAEPPDFDHPGILAENREQLQILFRYINRLPEQQRTALILLKIEGLPQAEAAAIMEISEKAPESLFQRAKGNLRKYLETNEGK